MKLIGTDNVFCTKKKIIWRIFFQMIKKTYFQEADFTNDQTCFSFAFMEKHRRRNKEKKKVEK